MLDITLRNFEADVIEASRRQPVLLDIWAPWCGPCKALGPLLEKLETAYDNRFLLTKLNSDEQPEIAGQLSQMFGVRSIPFCVLFRDGQPVDGFVGALPESELRKFLDKHVPIGSGRPEGDESVHVRQLLASGRLQEALGPLRRAVAADPRDARARFDLLRTLLSIGGLTEARDVFTPVEAGTVPSDEDLSSCGVWLEACVAAAGQVADVAPSTSRADLDERFQRAQTHLAAGRFTQALDELLEILMRDKRWRDGAARTTFLAVLRLMRSFESDADAAATETADRPGGVVAPEAPRSAPQRTSDAYHRRLSMVLF